jgi:hypothetical protein
MAKTADGFGSSVIFYTCNTHVCYFCYFRMNISCSCDFYFWWLWHEHDQPQVNSGSRLFLWRKVLQYYASMFAFCIGIYCKLRQKSVLYNGLHWTVPNCTILCDTTLYYTVLLDITEYSIWICMYCVIYGEAGGRGFSRQRTTVP